MKQTTISQRERDKSTSIKIVMYFFQKLINEANGE